MKRAARAVVLSHFTVEAGLVPFFAPCGENVRCS